MKTLIVCSKKKINDHVGEYYDGVVEVPHQPTIDNIESDAQEIIENIRDLWKQDVSEDINDKMVVVYLDAASPYNAMLIDFQIVMEKEEGIRIELPYLDSAVRTTDDEEANEIIRKLEERKQGDVNNG